MQVQLPKFTLQYRQELQEALSSMGEHRSGLGNSRPRTIALGLGIMLDFLVQFGEGAIQTDETPNKSQVWVGGAKNVLIIPSNMRCTHNAVTFATGGQWL